MGGCPTRDLYFFGFLKLEKSLRRGCPTRELSFLFQNVFLRCRGFVFVFYFHFLGAPVLFCYPLSNPKKKENKRKIFSTQKKRDLCRICFSGLERRLADFQGTNLKCSLIIFSHLCPKQREEEKGRKKSLTMISWGRKREPKKKTFVENLSEIDTKFLSMWS